MKGEKQRSERQRDSYRGTERSSPMNTGRPLDWAAPRSLGIPKRVFSFANSASNVLVLSKNTAKYLGVRRHDVCDVLAHSLEKIYGERKNVENIHEGRIWWKDLGGSLKYS